MPRKTFVAGDVLTASDCNLLAQDGYVTNASLDTTAGEPGGAWTTWAPSYTNLTIGNGTVVARYTKIGKTVHFVWQLTWGSTTSTSGGAPRFTVPLTAQSDHPLIATAHYFDANTSLTFFGWAIKNSTTAVELRAQTEASGSDPVSAVSSTVPMTHTTSDIWRIVGTYEAA